MNQPLFFQGGIPWNVTFWEGTTPIEVIFLKNLGSRIQHPKKSDTKTWQFGLRWFSVTKIIQPLGIKTLVFFFVSPIMVFFSKKKYMMSHRFFVVVLNSLQKTKYYVQVYLYISSNISSTYLSRLPPPITNIKVITPKKTYITNTKKSFSQFFPKNYALFLNPQNQSLRGARACKW